MRRRADVALRVRCGDAGSRRTVQLSARRVTATLHKDKVVVLAESMAPSPACRWRWPAPTCWLPWWSPTRTSTSPPTRPPSTSSPSSGCGRPPTPRAPPSRDRGGPDRVGPARPEHQHGLGVQTNLPTAKLDRRLLSPPPPPPPRPREPSGLSTGFRWSSTQDVPGRSWPTTPAGSAPGWRCRCWCSRAPAASSPSLASGYDGGVQAPPRAWRWSRRRPLRRLHPATTLPQPTHHPSPPPRYRIPRRKPPQALTAALSTAAGGPRRRHVMSLSR
jgi:hypothetical protein